jgi:hypothetical protein
LRSTWTQRGEVLPHDTPRVDWTSPVPAWRDGAQRDARDFSTGSVRNRAKSPHTTSHHQRAPRCTYLHFQPRETRRSLGRNPLAKVDVEGSNPFSRSI